MRTRGLDSEFGPGRARVPLDMSRQPGVESRLWAVRRRRTAGRYTGDPPSLQQEVEAMIRKNTIAILLAACCAVLMVAPAHAVTWGGEVFGAFNTYSMKDWNDAIDFSNQNGGNADNINNGFGGGLGLRVWPNSNWMIAGTWEPMFASTKDKATNEELKLNGNSIQGTVAYFFPTTAKARYGVGAGLGAYLLSGT